MSKANQTPDETTNPNVDPDFDHSSDLNKANDTPETAKANKAAADAAATNADVSDDRDEEIINLTLDLQRTRADFENYRKRVDTEKQAARDAGQSAAILKQLPVVDNIERAIVYIPEELKDNKWVQSVSGLIKNLEKSLDALNVARIDAKPGSEFNPELHEAIQFDEDAEGDKDVVADELQAGYTLNGRVIRHAMVKVTKQ